MTVQGVRAVTRSPVASTLTAARVSRRETTRLFATLAPGGVIVFDRYAVYLYIDDSQRQLCLAHVLRGFGVCGLRRARTWAKLRATTVVRSAAWPMC